MRIAIIGTRGIPNRYGGFEAFAEYLSVGLVKRNCEVVVYAGGDHPDKGKYCNARFNGVEIIYRKNPETRIGTAGQFLYDLNCIRDARKRSFDVILQLGYTSSSIWSWYFPKKARLVTNMDGLEWKRTKYSGMVKRFLKVAEKWAVKASDILVADSPGIADHLNKRYGKPSTYIPYGELPVENFDKEVPLKFGLIPGNYLISVARLEPENNIETMIKAYLKASPDLQLVITGNVKNDFAKKLQHEHASDRIKFIGGVYEKDKINALRHFAAAYLHGHSVGGTNPSLLESMACKVPVIAHDNPFNRHVLSSESRFFSDMDELAEIMVNTGKNGRELEIEQNILRLKEEFDREKVVDAYLECFESAIGTKVNP